MTYPTDSPYITLTELADYLKVSRSTVNNWLRDKKFPPHTYIKLGRAYRFHKDFTIAALHNMEVQLELPFDKPVNGELDD